MLLMTFCPGKHGKIHGSPVDQAHALFSEPSWVVIEDPIDRCCRKIGTDRGGSSEIFSSVIDIYEIV